MSDSSKFRKGRFTNILKDLQIKENKSSDDYFNIWLLLLITNETEEANILVQNQLAQNSSFLNKSKSILNIEYSRVQCSIEQINNLLLGESDGST